MAVYGVECCPFLGLQGDSSSYSLYPSAGACCLADEKRGSIAAGHQKEYCLMRQYVQCPHLAKTDPGAEDAPGRLYLPLWAMVGVIFLTVGAAWGILGLIDRVGLDVPAGPPLQSVAPPSGSGSVESIAPTVQPVGQTTARSGESSATPRAASTAASASASAVVSTSTSTAVASVTPTSKPPSPTAAPTRAAAASTATGRVESYVVQPGDTLISIARTYGVTLEALAQANNMRQDDVLQAGARLTVPSGKTIHVVQSGDTLSGIAQKYGVPADQIMTANQLGNDVIIAGQQLVIPTR